MPEGWSHSLSHPFQILEGGKEDGIGRGECSAGDSNLVITEDVNKQQSPK